MSCTCLPAPGTSVCARLFRRLPVLFVRPATSLSRLRGAATFPPSRASRWAAFSLAQPASLSCALFRPGRAQRVSERDSCCLRCTPAASHFPDHSCTPRFAYLLRCIASLLMHSPASPHRFDDLLPCSSSLSTLLMHLRSLRLACPQTIKTKNFSMVIIGSLTMHDGASSRLPAYPASFLCCR